MTLQQRPDLVPHVFSLFRAIDVASLGWIRSFALEGILYLCGEDCLVRYHAKLTTLAELETQAEENLRHSFAVVGTPFDIR